MSAWARSFLFFCLLACLDAFRVDDAHNEDSQYRAQLLGRAAADSIAEEASHMPSTLLRPRFSAVMDHQFSHSMALALTTIGVVAFCATGAFLIPLMRNTQSAEQDALHTKRADVKEHGAPRSPFGEPRRDVVDLGISAGISSSAGHAVFLVRVQFLTASLALNLIPVTVGLAVYKLSNSLVVELDAVTALTDVFALLVNIAVECSKRKATAARQILCLDLTGAGISLLLLVTIAVYGVMQAIDRYSKPTASGSDVHHLGYMCCYNMLAVACDGLTLVIWFCMRHGMSVAGEESTRDQLNTFSSLMHSCVNMVQDVSVTTAILCIWYVSTRSGESRKLQQLDTVAGDVFGSALVCFCVLISAAFMLRESVSVVQKFWSLQAAEDSGCEPRSPSAYSHDEPESEAAPEQSLEGNCRL
mmetsp:Transcript_41987/g.96417  ORF Transcript_41987/g.96417 Transcript_41987/m.96417 type:complete len:416 (-) Transcript_41987:31-1278(-)